MQCFGLQGATSWLVFYLMNAKGAADSAKAAVTVSGLELGGLVGGTLAGFLSDGYVRFTLKFRLHCVHGHSRAWSWGGLVGGTLAGFLSDGCARLCLTLHFGLHCDIIYVHGHWSGLELDEAGMLDGCAYACTCTRVRTRSGHAARTQAHPCR